METSGRQSNPIFVAQSISKLVEQIKSKQNSEPALKYLKDKCIASEDVTVSLTASKGLVMLVEANVLQMPTMLSELVSALTVTKSYTGIIATICDLLQMDLKHKISTKGKYKCPFNLRAPQHPLISVLNRQSATWVEILSRIKCFYESEDKTIKFYTNELFCVFYIFVICNPTEEVPEVFQYKLWNFLIDVEKHQSVDVMLYVLMWMRMSVKSSSFLIDAIGRNDIDDDTKEVLILWLTSLLLELLEQQQNPSDVLSCLRDTLQSYQHSNNAATYVLIMLAECVSKCPAIYLRDLLNLCKLVIGLNANEFALVLMKALLLQWLAYGCILTADSLQIANDIFESKPSLDKTKQSCNKKLALLISTNRHVHAAVQLSVLAETLQVEDMETWLKRADKLPTFALKNLFPYFAALLLYEFENNPTISLKVIEILLKIIEVYKESATQVLTLFLYKLSNCTKPQIHFALLKALPKMCVLKENLPLVLNTLELIRKGMSNFKSFAITLFFDLWEIDAKFYPHLQNALVAACDTSEQWEFCITKAHVLKQICIKRPELHGRELVGHLSEILNKCSGESGEVASALAIDGIKALCKAGIIDIASTWKELAPRFSKETRKNVIVSLCDLMSEISCFDPSECPDKLTDEIIAKLWYYATMHEDVAVISAAYNGLACFTLEQISPQLLEVIHSDKSESTPDLLPFNLIKGDYWIQLLLQSRCTALEATEVLLVKCISNEIAGYRSGTYKVDEGHREPPNYNYLPEHSIVRALGNYLSQQVQKWQDVNIKPTYLQCLRVLGKKYSKPLPPMDWCFLQELVHSTEARICCITLASHQVQLSGTGRRLIENYLTALTHMTENDEDIKTIYENLKYLCNSIQPITLRPFIETSLTYALEKARSSQDNEQSLFGALIKCLKQTLSDSSIHDANRMVLSQIVTVTAQQMDVDHPLFATLLECIVALPVRYIDELSSPRMWKEASSTKMQLSVKVRCALALEASASPLIWMNDFIDAACFIPSQRTYILKNIIHVMESYRDSDHASAWILELLGHVQMTIANENTTSYQIQFLCDVFVLSMVVLSGQDIFVADELVTGPMHMLFPQSVAHLLKLPRWKPYTSQVLEWLYHMTNYENTPVDYKVPFYKTLAALRHEAVFERSSKWMKYLGCTVPFDNQC